MTIRRKTHTHTRRHKGVRVHCKNKKYQTVATGARSTAGARVETRGMTVHADEEETTKTGTQARARTFHISGKYFRTFRKLVLFVFVCFVFVLVLSCSFPKQRSRPTFLKTSPQRWIILDQTSILGQIYIDLQCSQQGSLNLCGDRRPLVTDVQNSESGGNLQTMPTRCGATMHGTSKCQRKQTPQFVSNLLWLDGIVKRKETSCQAEAHCGTHTCTCAANAAAPASPIQFLDKFSRVNATGLGQARMRSIAYDI